MVKFKPMLLAAVLMLLGVFCAQAQTAVHPKAYYDAITYEWTDAVGGQHTSALTEEATNPYQIIALLKKVYCDPNVPGPKYAAYDKNGNRERQVTYGAVEGGWNISAGDVTAPYEDGYTILMVALNNDLTLEPTTGVSVSYFTTSSQLLNYVSNNIASVQLLCDGLRMGEGEMAGTCFNISGNYNRFFLLGKGQARQKDPSLSYSRVFGEQVPFKEMFEQFSPTDGGAGSEITDFYAKMIGGEVYGVVHDCASVIQNEHYFSMAGKAGTTERSLTGMNIFIPDYRLKYWEDQYSYSYSTYTVDGRTMNPFKSISGYQFRTTPSEFASNYAQYNQTYAPKVGIYTITLDAQANETATEGKFDVVLDWTSSLDVMAGGTVGQDYTVYLVLTDEDGNETYDKIEVTGATTTTYTVDQEEHSYTLTYIVYGQPNDGEHDVFVAWSNQASVVIPGTSDFLHLALNHYESDYEASVEKNFYRNYLQVENEDAVNALTRDRVAAGENSFTLYRYDVANEDVLTPVATLTLTNYSTTRENYTIAYDNQEKHATYGVNPATSGTLTVANGVINLSDIMFVDQFTAETAENTHAARYGYILKENGADKNSNTQEVPVFKTNAAINGYYTQTEVTEDTERDLTANVKNANVEMTLQGNPAIYYYTLERGSNAVPGEEISNLQRRTDGTFMEMSNALGQAGNTYQPGTVAIQDTKVITGQAGDYMSYQPVIFTFGDDRVNTRKQVNDYGSPILRTGVAGLEVNVEGIRIESQYHNWKDENGEMCSIYNPVITIDGELPQDASVVYEPYMYRVWRLCDGIRNYIIDNTWGVPVNDWWSPRPADKLIAEQATNDTHIVLGDPEPENNDLAFGATNSAEISFVVRMYYKAVNTNEPMYYVVEKVVSWTNIETAVNEINAATQGETIYINAQGLQSNKPFDGVNIVVTRYSDGSTKTTKIVK